jgi:glycosyltransferase involved in cell wall biosynthesis
MDNFNITAIIPVLNRPKNVPTLINSFLETSPLDRVKMLFVTSFDCEEEVKEIKKFSGPIFIGFAPNEILTWSQRVNWGIIYSNVNNNSNNWILCGADDLRFLPNWFEEAEKASKDFDGVIGTNDLGNMQTIIGTNSTHPIVSRKYIMEQGTIDGELGKLATNLSTTGNGASIMLEDTTQIYAKQYYQNLELFIGIIGIIGLFVRMFKKP